MNKSSQTGKEPGSTCWDLKGGREPPGEGLVMGGCSGREGSRSQSERTESSPRLQEKVSSVCIKHPVSFDSAFTVCQIICWEMSPNKIPDSPYIKEEVVF